MTRFTRRGFTLNVGATAVAGWVARPMTTRAADTDLAGYVFANRIDEETGQPGLTVLDLAGGGEKTVDVPPPNQLFPVLGTHFGIAAFTDALLVLDAERAVATEVTPVPGTRFDEPLGGRGLYPSYPVYPAPSDRYALLGEGGLVSFLVDLERATALDLSAFAGEDRYFQVAALTPDGRRLVLGNGLSIVVVDLDTMKVGRTLAALADAGIRSPQLAPDGSRVAFAQRSGEDGAATIRVAHLDGEPAIVADIPGGFASLRWTSDDALLVVTIDDSDSTIDRLDVATGRTTPVGVVAGVPADVQVLAHGTRALVSSEPVDARIWSLLDVAADRLIGLPELDGMISLGPAVRDARAVLLGPDDYTGTGQAGERYAVLNTATGTVTTTVDRLLDQFHTIPVFSPDLRSVTIGVTGPAGDQLWLLDMVGGDLATISDHLGAQFSPDGRHVLTRKIGRGNPLEIRDLAGDVVRELGAYDQGWWVGAGR